MSKKSSLSESLTKEIGESLRSKPRSLTKAPRKHPGIGGWLYFFCVLLTLLLPIAFASRVVLLLEHPERTQGRWVTEAIDATLAIYGIVTGIALWTKRKTAITQTRVFILVSIGLQITGYVYGLATGSARWSGVVTLILEVAFWCLWLLYFARSRRVAMAFLDEPGEVDPSPKS
jgi:hypothetical protein